MEKRKPAFLSEMKASKVAGVGGGSVGRRIPRKAEKYIGYAFKDTQYKREDVFLLLGQHLNKP